jgi:hypothetical protein
MAVPSGDYMDGEGGFTPGCAITLCAMALVFMMYMLVSKVNQCDNSRRIPYKEIQTNIDTCSKITDTFNIKTR